MTAESTFRAKAPALMDRLIREFAFDIADVAAIAGNAGHESLGFTKLQEVAPTVKGSKGGWGWFQWTGPRRRQFEAFADGLKLARNSDAANIEFIVHELKTSERKAIDATKKAVGLQKKVIAFETAFERAGVKHYPSRLRWANIALEAYSGARPPAEPAEPAKDDAPPAPPPAPPKPAYKPSIQLVMAVIAALAAIIGGFFGLN